MSMQTISVIFFFAKQMVLYIIIQSTERGRQGERKDKEVPSGKGEGMGGCIGTLGINIIQKSMAHMFCHIFILICVAFFWFLST